jgi:hypothetical protein
MRAWIIALTLVVSVFQAVQKQEDHPAANQDPGKTATNPLKKTPARESGRITEQHPPAKQDSAKAKTDHHWDLLSSPNTSNWALVIVGTAGIFVAVWTLRKIGAQVHVMRWQAMLAEMATKATQDNAVAARANAEAAKEGAEATKQSIELFIGKERARIRVEPNELKLCPESDPFQINEVQYKVFCYGATPDI